MSYTLCVWALPVGAAPPTDVAAADALLHAASTQPPRAAGFTAFGAALYERFAPGGDDVSENDAWSDGSEAGDTTDPVLSFGLNTQGRHFQAAYQHAVVSANALGLNLHDPQSGEHFLADGRRLPKGRSVDAVDALATWRASDWAAGWQDLRRDALAGSAEALHDLGFLLREGVGPRLHQWVGRPHLRRLAAAVMLEAAATDDARRRQRLATLKAMPEFLRVQAQALRAGWQAGDPAARLAAIDAEITRRTAVRLRLCQLPWGANALDEATWLALREEAWDGESQAAGRLADLLNPYWLGDVRPPAPVLEDGRRRYLELAAEWGNGERAIAVASRLLVGENGWPLDVPAAVTWLRRAAADGAAQATPMADQLRQRLASGWSPAADRRQAEQLLPEADRASGSARLAALRKACELDHPVAWRRMGEAYLAGTDGLPQDPLAALAMQLYARKDFSVSDSGIEPPRPSAMKGIDAFDVIEVLRFTRGLVGHPDPWMRFARWRNWFDEAPAISVSITRAGERVVDAIPAPAAARRRTAPAAAPAPAQGTRPHIGRGHVLLAAGALGPLLLLGLGPRFAGMPARLAVLACAVAAGFGAWRVMRAAGRNGMASALVALVAALPVAGLLPAVLLLLRGGRR